MAEFKFTSENFKDEVLNSQIPVVVDFWATWCGPCKMMAPEIANLANEYEGKIKVGKVNVDEETQIATDYNIQAIPTVILFKNGKPEKTSVGFKPKSQLISEFNL